MTGRWRGVGRPGRQWHKRSGTGALVGELPIGKLEVNGGAVAGGGGEFQCAAVYPTPEQSLQLGRQNLHLFRFKNTRFDVIGGAFYFLMVVRPCPPFPFPVCLKVACPILHCILETCSHITASCVVPSTVQMHACEVPELCAHCILPGSCSPLREC